jgi:cathepsin A (carboxypeptidase C)
MLRLGHLLTSSDKIGHYLDLPDVRAILGVDKSRGNFSSCDNTVGNNFNLALDRTGQTWLYVSALLERGVRVLSYVGTFDWICNHIGNQMWLEALEWTGKAGYNSAQLVDWKVKGKVAGSYKTSGNLSVSTSPHGGGLCSLQHLKIVGAGHMVPYDKPAEALAMLDSWLGGAKLSEE